MINSVGNWYHLRLKKRLCHQLRQRVPLAINEAVRDPPIKTGTLCTSWVKLNS